MKRSGFLDILSIPKSTHINVSSVEISDAFKVVQFFGGIRESIFVAKNLSKLADKKRNEKLNGKQKSKSEQAQPKELVS